ncbi:response regulator transcription factor [Kribbella sp. NPDC023972]|uniref:response regulator transcription factor n=1 Tax=Kribbella sp. NPDC023972 TaxID=3154795 RepID=UPI0033C672E4
MTIRVGIADDQSLVRDGLRVQLGYAEGVTVIGEAANGDQAVTLARLQRPDVLLMDVRMPVLDGIEATRRIRAEPDLAAVRILILTTFDLDEHVFGALTAGASGFLLKDAAPEEIVHAVRVVAAGESLLAPAVTTRLIREFATRPTVGRPQPETLDSLTDREREVLVLVAQGLSNVEVAGRLLVSPLTAKTHVSRILTKLGLRDRTQLVVAAYEAGLVVPGGS